MSECKIAALILAGGYGTRFRPLTFTRSKPLIEFCNSPIIKHILDAISTIKVDKIVVALTQRQKDVIEYLSEYEKENSSAPIFLSFEEEGLGTCGAIANAKKLIEGHRILLFSCDSITSFPIRELLDFHKEKSYPEFTLGVSTIEDGFLASAIIKDENDLVTDIDDKPSSKKRNCLVNAGFSVIEPRFLNRLEEGKFSDLGKELFMKIISEKQLYVFTVDNFFVGVNELYDIISGVPKFLGGENETLIDKSADIHPSVTYEKSVVVGANCKIGENTKLEKCVVLPGAVIGKNCVISNSIIGWKDVIGNNVIITDMCVLGEKVTIEDDTELSQFFISPFKVVNASNAFIPLAKIII